MANIGYRTFNGSTDLADFNLGNLASANSVPETWIFAGRILYASADAELVHSPGYDPIDWFIVGAGANYGFFDGAGNAIDGPTASTTLDAIVVIRKATSTAARWSVATHNGSVWSSFTHTNSSVTFSNRTYPGSGVIEVANTLPLNARIALLARCSSSISDGDVATLTTDLAAWSALSTITNLWRFDQTPITDTKGTATQNTLTGTSVTAAGFPLDAGGGAATPSRSTLMMLGVG